MKPARVQEILAGKIAWRVSLSKAPHEFARLRGAVIPIVEEALAHLDAGEEETVRKLAGKRPPAALGGELLRLVGLAGMWRWIICRPPVRSREEARQLAREWLAFVQEADRDDLLKAAIRVAAGQHSEADRQLLTSSFEKFRNSKEKKMADYVIDQRGLPPAFDSTAFETGVENYLDSAFGLKKTDSETAAATVAVVKGALLLKEFTDPNGYGFAEAIQDAWKSALQTTTDAGGKATRNKDTYKTIVDTMLAFPDRNGQPILDQELASVSGYVIENALQIPVGSSNFSTQVRIGIDKYVQGAPPSDSLALPPLTGDASQDLEIQPENVRAVGVIYLGLQMDRSRLFAVLDRVTEIYMQGLLPLGYDLAARAIEKYHFDSPNRLSPAERQMIFSRVLGAPGGDVSKEVQPNRDFDSLLTRFIASLAEYDRQRRVADLISQGKNSLSLTAEGIRKAGRDLACNASLYGWSGSQTAARRIKEHVILALNVLKMPSVLKVYGVNSPYQVLERVTLNEFGQAPNIVKYRTLAEAGNTLMELVAKNTQAWSTNSGLPLFEDDIPANLLTSYGAAPRRPSYITIDDKERMITQAQNWIAVSGIGNEQVDKMSQPADTAFMPSMPSQGAVSSKAPAGGDIADKLQQMIKSGATPSLDQLQQLLPAFR